MELVVENGCFSYVKGQPILQNINFNAKSGELLAILGPNGAGKTTLLRCMMGFLSWDSGSCKLDGEEMSQIPAKKLWKKIAYVPQAKGTVSSLLVSDMLLLGCTSHLQVFSKPGSKEKKQVTKIAEQLGISYLLNKKCNEISGGELQMVLIARALAAKPKLLILDEPESNLDFKNQLIVLDTMSKLAADGMCCIFNTHYPTHALMRATKALIVQKNGEVFFGETNKIVTEKTIEKAFGVKTVIGEVETEGNQYKSILPLHISKEESHFTKKEASMQAVQTEHKDEAQRRIAVITAIFSQYSMGDKINEIFHEYSEFVVGRMGMPYRDGDIYIVNVILDASFDEIHSIFHQLTILPDVQTKVTFAN